MSPKTWNKVSGHIAFYCKTTGVPRFHLQNPCIGTPKWDFSMLRIEPVTAVLNASNRGDLSMQDNSNCRKNYGLLPYGSGLGNWAEKFSLRLKV